MTCKEYSERISLYIDKVLSEEESYEFETHIKECNQCKEEYEQILNMIKQLNKLPLEELPEGYCKRLHEKLIKDGGKKMKIKWNWRTYTTIAAALIIVISIPLFFNSASLNSRNTSDMAQSEDVSFGGAVPDKSAPMPAVSPEIKLSDEATDGRGFIPPINGDAPVTSNDYRDKDLKIIKNGNLSLETSNYDLLVSEITSRVKSSGGYIENFQTYTNNYSYYDAANDARVDLKNGNMTVRVPQEAFEEVINYLSGIAEVKSQGINETDMTKYYYDTESKVTNLELQEKRLREFLDRAENIGELIQLEQELNRIRTEIESYKSNLGDIDYRASYASINIDIREVEDKDVIKKVDDKLWKRVSQSFVESVNNMIDFIENFIVFIFAFIPVFAVIIVPIIIIVILVKKLIKKIRK